LAEPIQESPFRNWLECGTDFGDELWCPFLPPVMLNIMSDDHRGRSNCAAAASEVEMTQPRDGHNPTTGNGTGSGPLAGVRVLDLTWVLSGPYAAMTLCDLGAEVIKVERPPYGDIARTTGPFVDDESAYFISINRGKRSVSLDLRAEEGHEAFLRLVEQVDVVMENFTPGVMAKLGLGYETLAKRNPRLIMCSVSGFGQTGPDRDLPALDIIVQGMGGVMSITGHPGEPPARPGYSIGDMAGGLFTAIGVLSALVERSRSGLGQQVDVAMLDAQVALMENAIIRHCAAGVMPGPIGTRHPLNTPFQAFPASDGWIVIAGVKDWALFCARINRDELIFDERFATKSDRNANHGQLEPLLFETFRTRTVDEWVSDLSEVCLIGPLNTVDRVVADPQVQAREMIVELPTWRGGRMKAAGTPVKLSRTPGGPTRGASRPGEHTEQALAAAGLSEERIADLIERGIAASRENSAADATADWS
jgi:CoA:oxalate CoA-transferase